MGLSSDTLSSGTAWKALRLYGLYRILLAGFFLLLIFYEKLPRPFGVFRPELFDLTVNLYLLSGVVILLFASYQWPNFRRQVFIQVMTDFLVLAILIFASGGVNSGIGMFLVMSVAAGSLLLMGKTAFLFAAVATLVILLVELGVMLSATPAGIKANFAQAGLVGAVLFVTASLSHHLASRLRTSEALAAQRAEDLASLARLNASIVQRMRSGIIVLNSQGKVRLANAAAAQLIGVDEIPEQTLLADCSSELEQILNNWYESRKGTHLLRSPSRMTDIQVSFAYLDDRDQKKPGSNILIFLEDAAAIRQRAQQLKLASLGGLTANIAHEIRNPLGAISHAGQLLSEANYLHAADQRLLKMINEHCVRMNQIIENILQLGRRQDAIPESFELLPWLEKFIDEFQIQNDLSRQDVKFSAEHADICITMDNSQLHQVLWNLCENALRYSRAEAGQTKIELQTSVDFNSRRPCLDVIDRGPGIPEEKAELIFEPFYTDRADGTGLGLYIASELCESNHAQLTLHENTKQGCCFRIIFAHPDKQIDIE